MRWTFSRLRRKLFGNGQLPPSALTEVQRPLSIYQADVEPSVTVPLCQAIRDDVPCVEHMQQQQQQRKESKDQTHRVNAGIFYFNGKPTKGMKYLVEHGVVEEEPECVAKFLLSQDGLSKESIGEYLGAISSPFNMAVLECLVKQANIEDKPVDEALRKFQLLFRMPGEAQKIDKIMDVFSKEYFRNSQSNVFRTDGGVFFLSYSIMMLQTSLHNRCVKNPPNKSAWRKMNRGGNDGDNFPDDYLYKIFDRIRATAFVTGRDHTQVVTEIEKQMIGSTIDHLCTSQRFLVHQSKITTIQDLEAPANYSNEHKRCLFLFNDIAVVCKKRGQHQLVFKDTFSLLDMKPVKFATSHYKNGVQVHFPDRSAPFQFDCRSHSEREAVLLHLSGIKDQLKFIEDESQDQDHAHSTGSSDHSGDNPVDGVGDDAVVSVQPSLSRQFSGDQISQDSGFTSRPLTPTLPLAQRDVSLTTSPGPTRSSIDEIIHRQSEPMEDSTFPSVESSQFPNLPGKPVSTKDRV